MRSEVERKVDEIRFWLPWAWGVWILSVPGWTVTESPVFSVLVFGGFTSILPVDLTVKYFRAKRALESEKEAAGEVD